MFVNRSSQCLVSVFYSAPSSNKPGNARVPNLLKVKVFPELCKFLYQQLDRDSHFKLSIKIYLPRVPRFRPSQTAVPPFLAHSLLSSGLPVFSVQLDTLHGDDGPIIRQETATPEERPHYNRVQERAGMPLVPLNLYKYKTR